MTPRLSQVLLIEPELSREDLLVPASRGRLARDSLPPTPAPTRESRDERLGGTPQPRGSDLQHPVFACAAPPAQEVGVFLFP